MTPTQWNLWHPRFQEHVRQRCRPDVVGVRRALVAADLGLLLRSGCVSGVSMRRGRPVAEASLVGLLVSGELGLIERVMAQNGPQSNVEDALLAYASGETERASSLLEGSRKQGLDALAMALAAALDHPDWVRQWLVRASGRWHDRWSSTACRATALLLDDRVGARRLLDEASRRVALTYPALLLAHDWALLAGDEGAARSWLERVERAAATCCDWVMVAELWFAVLGDGGRAVECLARARQWARDSQDWIWLAECAAAWGPSEEAAAMLDCAATGPPSVALARAYAHVAGDEARALGVLDGLCAHPQTSSVLISAAELAHQIDRLDMALLLLERAEGAASKPADRAAVASAWAEIGGDRQRAAALLVEAESSCSTMEHWDAVYGAWHIVSRQAPNTVAALHKGEERLVGCHDWLSWSRHYLAVGDEPAALAALENAEKRVVGPMEWLVLAEALLDMQADLERVRRALGQVEALAIRSSELLEAAEHWLWALRDADAARRCLARGELLARSCGDRAQLAVGFHGLGDSAGVARVLERATEESETAGDYCRLAQAWREVGNEAAMRASLQRAQALAQDEWKLNDVARHWIALAFDRDDAHSCWERAQAMGADPIHWDFLLGPATPAGPDEPAPATAARPEPLETAAPEAPVLSPEQLARRGDLEGARQALRRGEREATSSGELCELARTWRSLFGPEGSAPFLLHARQHADTAIEWVEVGYFYRLLLGDDVQAMACFERARLVADTLPQRLDLIRAVFRHGPDPTYAAHLLDSLRIVGAAVEVLCAVARTWSDLGESAKSLQRMAQAEELAVTAHDWVELANAWWSLARPEKALQYADLASQKAEQVHELRDLAWHYAYHLKQPERGRAALIHAESLARWDFEWRELARAWSDFYHDEDAARRCRQQATYIN